MIHYLRKALLLPVSILFLSVTLYSCNNAEGEGGLATITGKVTVEVYDQSSGELLGIGPAVDERVYIVYGDNVGYDDDIRTKYDGTYKFEFLYEGAYELYAYSECEFDQTECLDGNKAEVVAVEISSTSSVTQAPNIVIRKYQ